MLAHSISIAQSKQKASTLKVVNPKHRKNPMAEYPYRPKAEELKRIATQHSLFMAEVKQEHGNAQIKKMTGIATSTTNNVIKNGAVPYMDIVLALSKLMGINFHLVNARLTGIPLPNTPKADDGAVLRDLDRFAAAIKKLPVEHRSALVIELGHSLQDDFAPEDDSQ